MQLCEFVLGISQPEPEKFLLPTTDYLYNLTNQNVSEWILKTTSDYILKRSHSDVNIFIQI